MAVDVPAQFEVLRGDGGELISASEPIAGDTAGAIELVRANAHAVYAHCCRRALLSWGSMGSTSDTAVARQPLTTTAGAYEDVFERPSKLSADTDTLRFDARGKSIDVRVQIYENSAKTVLLDTLTAATPAATEATLTDTSVSLSGAAGWTGDEDLIIVVGVMIVGAGPGLLYGFRVVERSLVAADLP